MKKISFAIPDNIEAISRNIELLGTVRYEILDNQRKILAYSRLKFS